MNRENLNIENAKTKEIINLTKKQQEGVEVAKKRYTNRESFTCIAGYA